jgi:hypothetical protein
MIASNLVNNVVSRAKKNGLNLKLLALNQVSVCLGNGFKKIFLLYKQMWYVPFFWSLTWFSYWILREVLVLKTPLIQVNPGDCVGAVISISVLSLATPRLGASIRKKSLVVGTLVGSNIKKMFFHARFRSKNHGRSEFFSKLKHSAQDIQMEPLKTQKTRLEARAEREKLEQVTYKLMKSQSDASALSSRVGYSDQNSISQEISSECLTCANLISCRHRRCESVESQVQGSKGIKCPFAEELSSNRTAAA